MIIEGVKIEDKSAYKRGRGYVEDLIRKEGFAKAKEVAEAHIESSKDFNDYDDFDRGVEAVLKEWSIAS